MTLEFITEYLDYLETNKIFSSNSLRFYRRDLLDFENFCHRLYSDDFEINKLNESILDKFYQNIIQQGRTIASANRKLTALRGLWTWLRERAIVSRDPFTELNRQSQFRNSSPRYLSEEEISLLLDHPGHDLKIKMILELIYATGIRVGELVKLTVTDIDLENQIITIARSNKYKERIIPFNELTARYIREFIEINQRDINSKLLQNRLNEPVSEREVFRLIRDASKQAGIGKRVSPSIIRNSFIRHMKDRGAHKTLLRDITGQKTVFLPS